MKFSKFLSPFFFLLAVWSASSAQDIKYARQVIDKMASPEFEGRGYVEDGDAIAAITFRNNFKI